MLSEKPQGAQWALRLVANATVEPTSDTSGYRIEDLPNRCSAAGREEVDGHLWKGGRNLVGWGQDPAEGEHPELGVGDHEVGVSVGEESLECRCTKAEETLLGLGRGAVGEEQFGHHGTCRRPPEVSREWIGGLEEVKVAKSGELGVGTLVQADLDQREDLGGRSRRRLAAAGVAQHPALCSRPAGEHRQYQVAVTVRVVVEHQGFVIEEEHDDMVSESGPREDPMEF